MIRSVYYKVYKNILKNLKTKRAFYKPLLTGLLKNRSGRNNLGQIVNYHRGGGVKRLYRNVCHSYVQLLTYNLKR
jgi:ribosomal protein L2